MSKTHVHFDLQDVTIAAIAPAIVTRHGIHGRSTLLVLNKR